MEIWNFNKGTWSSYFMNTANCVEHMTSLFISLHSAEDLHMIHPGTRNWWNTYITKTKKLTKWDDYSNNIALAANNLKTKDNCRCVVDTKTAENTRYLNITCSKVPSKQHPVGIREWRMIQSRPHYYNRGRSGLPAYLDNRWDSCCSMSNRESLSKWSSHVLILFKISSHNQFKNSHNYFSPFKKEL